MAKLKKTIDIDSDDFNEIKKYADIHKLPFGRAIVQLAKERLAGEGSNSENARLESLINTLAETNRKIDRQSSVIEKNSSLMTEVITRVTSSLSKIQLLVDGFQTQLVYVDAFISDDTDGALKRAEESVKRALKRFKKNKIRS